MRELRFFGKRNVRSHRKTNRRALTVVSRQPRTPAVVHAVDTLPSLPPGAMPQRTVELPKLPARTAFPAPTQAELDEAARRLTGSFNGGFRLAANAPLFRGEDTTCADYDKQRLERLRRMQDLAKTWPDHGVNLGIDQGPTTLVYATTGHGRFSDGTGTIPAVKR